jgi:NAD-dependent deacetylase
MSSDSIPPEERDKLDDVVQILRESESILFITGAGISADSGLPTYRGIGGLYNDADTPEGIPIEVALSGQMMQSKPELTWKYILQIESVSRGAKFNRAHEVIALIEKRFPRVWVLTQNVDGLHRRAGSTNVIDIHGDVHDLTCMECSYEETVPDFSGLSSLPKCPDCSGQVRPDVVLFGELLPFQKVGLMERELSTDFDVVFSIGTTSVFPYIAGPVADAKRRGKPTVEINPADTAVSHLVDIRLRLGSAVACHAIWEQFVAGSGL